MFLYPTDYLVSFQVTDDTILEGDPDDQALICLAIVTEHIDREATIEGFIQISDPGQTQGVDSKLNFSC